MLRHLSDPKPDRRVTGLIRLLDGNAVLARHGRAPTFSARSFVMVSTDSDFEGLLGRVSGANVVILRSCNYPTEAAAEVLRRNAIRIAQLPGSHNHLIILDR
jgi:hypothetical protein